MPETFDFGHALECLRGGLQVARVGWNGKGQMLHIVEADRLGAVDVPCICICTVEGLVVPWVASHTDVLAEDWHTV